ncbi:MAG: hypothetical protein LBJ59_09550 [Zoogloeaceae bacterium]|jgi:hypothetical protein|nr:hypothetical protein [Zoogloeaceae bacterium]
MLLEFIISFIVLLGYPFVVLGALITIASVITMCTIGKKFRITIWLPGILIFLILFISLPGFFLLAPVMIPALFLLLGYEFFILTRKKWSGWAKGVFLLAPFIGWIVAIEWNPYGMFKSALATALHSAQPAALTSYLA